MVQVLWENIGALIAGATISMLSWTILHLRGSCDEDDTNTDIDDRKSILLCERVGSIPVDHENFNICHERCLQTTGMLPTFDYIFVPIRDFDEKISQLRTLLKEHGQILVTEITADVI